MKQHFCCDCGEAMSQRAKSRCMECFRLACANGLRPTVVNQNLYPAPREMVVDTAALFRRMDEAFCAAMMRAVKARRERPPGMKVSTKPCTQRPKRIDPIAEVRMRSASALLVEAAGPDA